MAAAARPDTEHEVPSTTNNRQSKEALMERKDLLVKDHPQPVFEPISEGGRELPPNIQLAYALRRVPSKDSLHVRGSLVKQAPCHKK